MHLLNFITALRNLNHSANLVPEIPSVVLFGTVKYEKIFGIKHADYLIM